MFDIIGRSNFLEHFNIFEMFIYLVLKLLKIVSGGSCSINSSFYINTCQMFVSNLIHMKWASTYLPKIMLLNC